MMQPAAECVDLDLHRLELRYAAARVVDARAVERLSRSIEQSGQLIACAAVAAEPGTQRLVLIDGYRRVAALRRLGRDTVKIECWSCDLTQGLLLFLAHAHGRALAALEEAMLLRELVQGQGLTQHEAARRCGRDVSWVNRRLQLLTGLPETVLGAVKDGVLSVWAATRVFGVLARANSAHAEALLRQLRAHSLSTRQLRSWFEEYERGSREQRERLVANPHLLLEVLRETETQRAAQRLRAGPEGEVLTDLRGLEALIARVRKRLPNLNAPLSGLLVTTLARLQLTLSLLNEELTRYCTHDPRRDPPGGMHLAHPGQELAGDLPAAQALA